MKRGGDAAAASASFRFPVSIKRSIRAEAGTVPTYHAVALLQAFRDDRRRGVLVGDLHLAQLSAVLIVDDKDVGPFWPCCTTSAGTIKTPFSTPSCNPVVTASPGQRIVLVLQAVVGQLSPVQISRLSLIDNRPAGTAIRVMTVTSGEPAMTSLMHVHIFYGSAKMTEIGTAVEGVGTMPVCCPALTRLPSSIRRKPARPEIGARMVV